MSTLQRPFYRQTKSLCQGKWGMKHVVRIVFSALLAIRLFLHLVFFDRLKEIAAFDLLARVFCEFRVHPVMIASVSILITFSTVCQLVLMAGDKSLLCWHLLNDIINNFTEHYLVASKKHDPHINDTRTRRMVHLESAKYCTLLKRLDWITPEFLGYTKLVNFATGDWKLKYFPTLTVQCKFWLMTTLSLIELVYILTAALAGKFHNEFPNKLTSFCIPVGTFILSVAVFVIQFISLYPILYLPVLVLDGLQALYIAYTALLTVSVYSASILFYFSSFYVAHCYHINNMIQMVHNKSRRFEGLVSKRRKTLVPNLRILRYFNQEHTRLTYFVSLTNRDLISRLLFMFVATIAPINILWVNMLYFGAIDSKLQVIIILLIVSQFVSTISTFTPLVKAVKQMHETQKYFVSIQYNLELEYLHEKIKTLLLFERILNEKKITVNAGPLGPITKKSFLEASLSVNSVN